MSRSQRVLDRVVRHMMLERAQLLHEIGDDAARIFARKHPRQAGAVIAGIGMRRFQPGWMPDSAAQESGAELRRLRAQDQRGGDALAVHDAAGRDQRHIDRARDLRNQRHQADAGLLEIAQKGAAMAAGLDALDADRIGAGLFPGFGFGHRGGGADHQRTPLPELRHRGGVEHAESEADHRRRQRQQGGDLVPVVFAESGRRRAAAKPRAAR